MIFIVGVKGYCFLNARVVNVKGLTWRQITGVFPREGIAREMNASKCIGKEVATKYFLPGDLKLNLFLLGFQN